VVAGPLRRSNPPRACRCLERFSQQELGAGSYEYEISMEKTEVELMPDRARRLAVIYEANGMDSQPPAHTLATKMLVDPHQC